MSHGFLLTPRQRFFSQYLHVEQQNLAPALIESVKTAGLVLITDLSTQQSTLPDQPSSDRIDGYFDREGVLHFNETIDI